ncbi:neurogenin-1 [Ochlerotatus camptorhynchus]|uniref:neurogenin-1 n=1 Tax=Ochlerotatus camptorhynchus TaxID=644619 RepID=UPI0031D2E69C
MPKRKRSKSPNLDLIEDGFDDELDSNDDKQDTPVQRNAANARERARMRVLSKAFFNLKRNIPWVPADTKLSKLDTLRLAKNYITYLAATLDGQSVEDFSTNLAQPPKTAWPFIFQPVQSHEATKPGKLVPVTQSTGGSSTEKWPNIRTSSNGATAATTSTENNIKSQNFSPSMTANATSATAGGRSFSTSEQHFGESRVSLSLDRHQPHTVIHASHHQQHNQHPHHHHHHHMTVATAGIETSNHMHSFHHHHMAMGSD